MTQAFKVYKKKLQLQNILYRVLQAISFVVEICLVAAFLVTMKGCLLGDLLAVIILGVSYTVVHGLLKWQLLHNIESLEQIIQHSGYEGKSLDL